MQLAYQRENMFRNQRFVESDFKILMKAFF